MPSLFPFGQRGFASALLASTMLVPAAMAQTSATPSSEGLEIVTVTSQKIGEQDVQKVPISIQVLDSSKLENLHIKDFRDFELYMPSVSFTTGGQGSSGGPGQ